MSKLRQLADLFRQQDGFGALHIIVEDGNVQDEHLDYCEQQEDVTEADKAFIEHLRTFTADERDEAWEIAFVEPPAIRAASQVKKGS